MYRAALFVVLLVVIISCDSKVDKDVKKVDSLNVVVDDSVHNRLINKAAPKSAPEWYNNFPEAEGYLYIAANARSKSAALAEDKAIHLARVTMAQMTAEDSVGSSGEHIIQQNLQRSMVVKKSRIKDNGYWRVFVLLRMKTTE